jgi:hypothetical protein
VPASAAKANSVGKQMTDDAAECFSKGARIRRPQLIIPISKRLNLNELTGFFQISASLVRGAVMTCVQVMRIGTQQGSYRNSANTPPLRGGGPCSAAVHAVTAVNLIGLALFVVLARTACVIVAISLQHRVLPRPGTWRPTLQTNARVAVQHG